MMNNTPQTDPAINRLGATASRVKSIDSIRQVFGQFAVDYKRVSQPMDVTVSRGTPSVTMEDNIVHVTLAYGFVATPENSKNEQDEVKALPPIIEIRAVFDIDYTFSDGEALSNEDLEVFANINGNLNATAYWREYIDSCLSRSHLPPFVLPPFNAAKHIMRLKEEAAQHDAPGQNSTTADPAE